MISSSMFPLISSIVSCDVDEWFTLTNDNTGDMNKIDIARIMNYFEDLKMKTVRLLNAITRKSKYDSI